MQQLKVLTNVLGVNRNQHVHQSLCCQQAHTQQHESLQRRSSFGPDVWQQHAHLPPKVLPDRRQGGGGRGGVLDLDGERGSQKKRAVMIGISRHTQNPSDQI